MFRVQDTSVSPNFIWISFLLVALPVAIASALHPVLAVVGVCLVIGGVATVIICMRWPELFLILALWTSFLKSAYIPGLAVGEFGATPYMVFITLAAFGFCFQLLTSKRRLILPSGFWLFLLFVSFTTLSLLTVHNIRLVAGVYARMLLDWLLFFLLVQMLTDRRRVNQIIIAIFIQAFIITTWGIVAGFQLELADAYHHRSSFFFWQQYQKNDFAAYLGLVLVLALAIFLVSRSRLKKLLAITLMGIVPIAWLFTFSRGGFLAIVTCLFVFLVLERNKRLLQQSLLAMIFIGFIGLTMVAWGPSQSRNLAVDGLRSIVVGESDEERHTYTVDLRFELVRVAVDVITSKPLWGVGFDQWQFYSPYVTRRYDPQLGEFREIGYSVHNRYLLIAVNSGLITLICYLGFLVITMINGLRYRLIAISALRTYLHVFIAAVLGIQVALLFAPSVLWEWPAIGILAGIVNVIKVEKRQILKEEQLS